MSDAGLRASCTTISRSGLLDWRSTLRSFQGVIQPLASLTHAAPSAAGLAQLSEDVHDLSYRLHPSVLDDLGLVEALKAECERVARSESLRVDVEADRLPQSLPERCGALPSIVSLRRLYAISVAMPKRARCNYRSP